MAFGKVKLAHVAVSNVRTQAAVQIYKRWLLLPFWIVCFLAVQPSKRYVRAVVPVLLVYQVAFVSYQVARSTVFYKAYPEQLGLLHPLTVKLLEQQRRILTVTNDAWCYITAYLVVSCYAASRFRTRSRARAFFHAPDIAGLTDPFTRIFG